MVHFTIEIKRHVKKSAIAGEGILALANTCAEIFELTGIRL